PKRERTLTMVSVEFHVPEFGDWPLLHGPSNIVDGYYRLETLERNWASEALSRHRNKATVWYWLISLHSRAMLSGFNFDCSKEELLSHTLRMQLLGLGLVSSKAALDTLLAGYYSVAYATIGHMIESALLCRYAEEFPQAARRFYRSRPGEPSSPRPRPMTVVSKLKGRYKKTRRMKDHTLVEDARRGWEAMSDGSHPSGIGIVQTLGERDGLGVLGATYHAELAEAGFRNGLTAAMLLVVDTGRLESQGEECETELVQAQLWQAEEFGVDPQGT
ncbi:MAG TPA: hypothetical protein VGW38_13430, partial [Chloroflexota bacterium]|nr:hypothetical protein [Chloroflexota bacterium]